MKTFKTLIDCDGYALFYRCVDARRYHVIDFKDLYEYCGEDDAQAIGERYSAELSEIDLDTVTEDRVKSALNCRGWEDQETLTDLHLVESLIEYGCGVPLRSVLSNNRRLAIKECRIESNVLDDLELYEQAMSRPVNQLGSTAREYGQGDLQSAITRGLQAHDPEAELMAKIQGTTQEQIDMIQCEANPNEIPSDDPIAFMMGYMAAMGGQEKADLNATAIAYHIGFKRGVAVRTGIAEPVKGIKIK